MYDNQTVSSSRAPILHKLLDHEPNDSTETPILNVISLEALHDDIKHNLEHILNTRLKGAASLTNHTVLAQSCLNYGVADFSGYNFLNDQSHQDLCETIKKTIEIFEPRLRCVTVTMLDNTEIELKRSLSIRIEATVCTLDSTHATIFNSSLDVVSKNFIFKS